jgi:hypothetical protein
VEAYEHLQGEGCPICKGHPSPGGIGSLVRTKNSQHYHPSEGGILSLTRSHQGRKYDTKTFIETARSIHGTDKYNYKKTEYTNSREKVTIICLKHGEFSLTANGHLRGDGCPICGGRKAGKDNNLAAEFPLIAKEWHPTRNGSQKPEHFTSGSGKKVWWQCSNHLKHIWSGTINGRTRSSEFSGCPECRSIELEKMRGGHYHPDDFPTGILSIAIYKAGLKFLGTDKYNDTWLLECQKCGDLKTIPRMSFTIEALRCLPCYTAELRRQAEGVGLTLAGMGKNSRYRLYRFNDCGHVQQLVTRNVKRAREVGDWGLVCKQCLRFKHENEAKDAGLTLLGHGKNKTYRLYRCNVCDYEQEISLSRVRQKTFWCYECRKEKNKSEAENAGLTMLGPGEKPGRNIYRLKSCNHEQEISPSSVRRNTFKCDQCNFPKQFDIDQ